MAVVAEPTLQELANKFVDSGDELEVTNTGDAKQLISDAAAQDSKPQAEGTTAAQTFLEGDDDWDDEDEEDEDWDSEDEELASALEWADLREGNKKNIFLFQLKLSYYLLY